jgi:carbonic anhydrase/acetyltransferase-like protein (isoleucine patch superfamily)
MAIYKFEQNTPEIAESAFIAENATIIGKVKIADNASVWFNVTMRGDNEVISVGEGSNIQEAAVLHTDMGYPMMIGKNVTVGHQVMLHGCTIEDGALIGMQAVVLNGAKIGKNCLVGAGALVTEGKVFPDNSLIIGSPAKAVRTLTPEDIAQMHAGTHHYVQRAQQFKTGLTRIG